MFSNQFLSLFKYQYFSHFTFIDSIIEVQSQNTGHWWKIQKVYLPISNMYRIYHRYSKSQPYHKQKYVHTPEKAYQMIKSHDTYILTNKKEP
jgi:hypothetical protein